LKIIGSGAFPNYISRDKKPEGSQKITLIYGINRINSDYADFQDNKDSALIVHSGLTLMFLMKISIIRVLIRVNPENQPNQSFNQS
jgi:hypothetical protein